MNSIVSMADGGRSAGALAALRCHWPEYLIEGWALCMFMISAGAVTTLLEAPGAWLRSALPSGDLRRVLIGVSMGLTAVALIYSPWGKRSGAHMNPAVTLTFWRLGKVKTVDALFYIAAQCVGGTLGVVLVATTLGPAFTAPPVSWVATLPGMAGAGAAFFAEFAISLLLMATVLTASNSPALAPKTGLFAGALVALFISLEAPLSGMSMNPARSLASALPANLWSGFWVYVSAPVVGMFAGAALYCAARGRVAVGCAKLLHPPEVRCIHCGHEPRPTRGD